jgi:8-oxo-dGTP pyrophosphatase MutT (NUDIX family)
MDTILCKKGCCSLKILTKNTGEGYKKQPYPFEKRKAGVYVYCGNKILLTQSYNKCWGIPKGQMEMLDENTKVCAERELKEETGLSISLRDHDLYRIVLDNCYIYRVQIENTDVVNVEDLTNLDSTGIGWVNIECAFDFNLNYLTKKILTDVFYYLP